MQVQQVQEEEKATCYDCNGVIRGIARGCIDGLIALGCVLICNDVETINGCPG